MIYAVNKQTKEHQVVGPYSAILMRDYWIVQADEDGWIEWRGRECPLPDDQLCEVKLVGDRHPPLRAKAAPRWRWDCNGRTDDIIAYRPILNDDKPQAPEWGGEGLPPVGIEVEVNHHDFGWVEAITLAMFGGCMVCAPNGGGFYGYSAHEIRPIRTDREEWIDQAADVAIKDGDALGNVYDALKSGELPQP